MTLGAGFLGELFWPFFGLGFVTFFDETKI